MDTSGGGRQLGSVLLQRTTTHRCALTVLACHFQERALVALEASIGRLVGRSVDGARFGRFGRDEGEARCRVGGSIALGEAVISAELARLAKRPPGF